MTAELCLQNEFIETQVISQMLQNVLDGSDDGKFYGNLIDLLRIPNNDEDGRNDKRKFKLLPSDDKITKLDAKQYCITRLLTFEYFDILMQSEVDEQAESILSALINEKPCVFIKKIMKHSYLLDECPKISLLSLSIINDFIQKRLLLQQANTTDTKIKNNKLNAFIYDWIRMDFFKCILTMLSLYSYPQSIEFIKHTQTIKQIMNGILSLCSARQLNIIKAHKPGHLQIDSKMICLKQTDHPNERNNDDDDENKKEENEIKLAKNIDLNALNKLYLDGNESFDHCNILIVGDGDFTFSNALISLWPRIVSAQCVNLKLITSTFHNIPTLIKKYYQFDIVDTIHNIQTSASNATVLYGVDATDLSRFYNKCVFDRIIFNFPQTETSVGDHRLKSANQRLIFEFLRSCEPILSRSGAIFIALHVNEFKAHLLRNKRKDDEIVKAHKSGKRYVEINPLDMFENNEKTMSVSHDQFFTWNVGEIIKRKELKWLKLKRSIPFHTQWYPGYNVTNVKGQLFDVCRAKIHIFKRAIK